MHMCLHLRVSSELTPVLKPSWLVLLSCSLAGLCSLRLFLGSDLMAGSTPSKEAPKSTASGSSGESMDSASVSSCESSPEEGAFTPLHSPDEPQKKVNVGGGSPLPDP